MSAHGAMVKGVVFVIDSPAIISREGVRHAAEYLYDVLVDKSLAGRPVLIVCNKQVGVAV